MWVQYLFLQLLVSTEDVSTVLISSFTGEYWRHVYSTCLFINGWVSKMWVLVSLVTGEYSRHEYSTCLFSYWWVLKTRVQYLSLQLLQLLVSTEDVSTVLVSSVTGKYWRCEYSTYLFNYWWVLNKWVQQLGPIYTKHQHQGCDDACNSVLIKNNGVAPEWGGTYFQVTPLISMRSKSLASSQSCRSLDADAGSLALQLLVNTVEVSTGIISSGLKFNG